MALSNDQIMAHYVQRQDLQYSQQNGVEMGQENHTQTMALHDTMRHHNLQDYET
jgi:hypothetical protein